jgi:NAD(P)H-hydrate epimerase
MENAGRGCAELLMRMNPERKPTVILCGPGNNGGDGFVIARHLDNHGWRSKVELFAACNKLPEDAASNHRLLLGRIEVSHHKHPSWSEDVDPSVRLRTPGGLYDSRVWIVDALFGAGLSRPLGAPYDEVAAQVNASRNPVLAVDIPSGLDCDTGEPLGPTVRATHTATFVAPKRGFLNPASREWTGEVHVIDIGAPRVLVEEFGSGRT